MKYFILIAVAVIFVFGCKADSSPQPINYPPVIHSVTASPQTVYNFGNSTFSCVAIDPDGDNLEYTWSCPVGNFIAHSNLGPSVGWTRGDTTGEFYAKVVVNDGRAIVEDSVKVTLLSHTGRERFISHLLYLYLLEWTLYNK